MWLIVLEALAALVLLAAHRLVDDVLRPPRGGERRDEDRDSGSRRRKPLRPRNARDASAHWLFCVVFALSGLNPGANGPPNGDAEFGPLVAMEARCAALVAPDVTSRTVGRQGRGWPLSLLAQSP
ncbi:MAG: hypothetical protein MZW92_66665 [Comamonadaceae bacterium]|nr:hypothetical protein [Comamonadaceae bacterium]